MNNLKQVALYLYVFTLTCLIAWPAYWICKTLERIGNRWPSLLYSCDTAYRQVQKTSSGLGRLLGVYRALDLLK